MAASVNTAPTAGPRSSSSDNSSSPARPPQASSSGSSNRRVPPGGRQTDSDSHQARRSGGRAWGVPLNGFRSPVPEKSYAQSAISSREPDQHAVRMHNRLLYLLVRSIGYEATVTTKQGIQYRGILSSAGTENELGVVLRSAGISKKLNGKLSNEEMNQKVIDTLIIPDEDLVAIDVVNTLYEPEFATDAEISARRQQAKAAGEKVLQPWKPDESVPGVDLSSGLESGPSGQQWDQFATNRELFGVESTFDEHLYTTRIDKNHPDYKRRLVEAEKIAKEIESSSHMGSAHIAEERGIVVDDSGLDEEDKYSGVQRAQKLATAKASGQPTESAKMEPQNSRELPHDPAIISSSVTDQSQKPSSAEAITTSSKDTTKTQRPGSSNDEANTQLKKELMGTFKQFVSSEKDRLAQRKKAMFQREKDGRLSDLMKFSQSFKLKTPVPEDLLPILAKDKAKQEQIAQKSRLAASSSGTISSRPSSGASTSFTGPSDQERPVQPARSSSTRPDAANTPPLRKVPSPSPIPPSQIVSRQPKPSGETPGFVPSMVDHKKLNVNAMEFTPNFGTPPAGSRGLTSPPSQNTPAHTASSYVSDNSHNTFQPHNRRSKPSSLTTCLSITKTDAFNPFKRFFYIRYEEAIKNATTGKGSNIQQQGADSKPSLNAGVASTDEPFSIPRAWVTQPTWPGSEKSYTEYHEAVSTTFPGGANLINMNNLAGGNGSGEDWRGNGANQPPGYRVPVVPSPNSNPSRTSPSTMAGLVYMPAQGNSPAGAVMSPSLGQQYLPNVYGMPAMMSPHQGGSFIYGSPPQVHASLPPMGPNPYGLNTNFSAVNQYNRSPALQQPVPGAPYVDHRFYAAAAAAAANIGQFYPGSPVPPMPFVNPMGVHHPNMGPPQPPSQAPNGSQNSPRMNNNSNIYPQQSMGVPPPPPTQASQQQQQETPTRSGQHSYHNSTSNNNNTTQTASPMRKHQPGSQ